MLQKALKKVLSLVYPTPCAICEKMLPDEGRGLCTHCAHEIKPIEPPFCQSCGRGVLDGISKCAECRHEKFHFERAYACTEYKGKIKSLLHDYKFKRRKYLKKLFSGIVSDFAARHVDLKNFDVIVPVPLNRLTLLKRGFNQSELLGKNLSKNYRIPCETRVLKKRNSARPQSLLTKTERKENISGAFLARGSKRIESKNVLLVDDILTTGQTASECARVLKEAGANRVWVLTLARGVN